MFLYRVRVTTSTVYNVVEQFYQRGFIVAGTTMFFCDTNP